MWLQDWSKPWNISVFTHSWIECGAALHLLLTIDSCVEAICVFLSEWCRYFLVDQPVVFIKATQCFHCWPLSSNDIFLIVKGEHVWNILLEILGLCFLWWCQRYVDIVLILYKLSLGSYCFMNQLSFASLIFGFRFYYLLPLHLILIYQSYCASEGLRDIARMDLFEWNLLKGRIAFVSAWFVAPLILKMPILCLLIFLLLENVRNS